MANLQVKLDKELQAKLESLSDSLDEKIIPKMLTEAGNIALTEAKAKLNEVIGSSGRSTGELYQALGVTGVKQDRNGNWNVKVGFKEPRSNGESNAKIATILEYGKSDQQARPFMKPAGKAVKDECIRKMKEIFDKEMEKAK